MFSPDQLDWLPVLCHQLLVSDVPDATLRQFLAGARETVAERAATTDDVLTRWTSSRVDLCLEETRLLDHCTRLRHAEQDAQEAALDALGRWLTAPDKACARLALAHWSEAASYRLRFLQALKGLMAVISGIAEPDTHSPWIIPPGEDVSKRVAELLSPQPPLPRTA
ncbi:MAG: hypothetical protein FJX76_17295 [Armatimonadetes bacterium]|nr:hypothetical protein [Armatimonadota bacterium]